MRQPSDRSIIGRWGALAAIVLAVASGCGRGSEIGALVQATGERRLVEPRLSGGFAWAPVSVGESGAIGGNPSGLRGIGTVQDPGRWAIVGVAARIREAVEAGAEDDEAHALGLAHLLLGDLDEAVGQLEDVAERTPRDAAVLSDLAAALIERGTAPQHARDLVRGLDFAEQALTLAPSLPEARFNKALALERMRLGQAALTAWEEYLRLDAASPWGEEASSRLGVLRRAGPERRWNDDETAFRFACDTGDRKTAASLARLHRQEATDAVLWNLLPRWAELAERGEPESGRALDALGCGADAVAEVTGDASIAQTVAQARAFSARPPELRALAWACRELVRGRRALEDLKPTEAREALANAVAGLESRGSPLRDFAALSRLSGEYYHGAVIEPAAEALQASADRAGHRIVAARIRWLRGLSLRVQGQFSPALALLGDAADRLERLGFAGDATFVRSMEAGAWRELGRDAEAWARDLAVFARLEEIPDPRRTQALLAESAIVTESEGLRSAAVALQQASLQYALRHESVYDRCDGQVWLARATASAGREGLAAQALEEAERLRPSVTDHVAQERIAAELALIRGGLALSADPGRAVKEASRAIDYFQATGKSVRLLEGLLLRARAAEAGGKFADAERDYVTALAEVEAERTAIADPHLRLSFFDTAFDLARELVRFAWSRGEREEALLFANRIRARTLRESREASSELIDLAELRRRLEPSKAVLFYASLPERTLVWVLRADAVSAHEIACTEAELHRHVQAWRRATLEGNLARSSAAARKLFALLVGPVEADLASARSVIVVPDGSLHQLSWAALQDPASGQPWMARTAIAVSPSLALGPGDGPHTITSAVVVGDPRFDRALFPELPDLPGAVEESWTIAASYPQVVLLTDGEATAEAMLDAAEHADVLHVAAHGLADPFDAERSALVLAPGGSVASQGVLLARDIRERDLARLRLVVLAACRSGDGPLARAEGPLSLARPFLQSGARAVLVSLFDLPDRQLTTAAIHRHLSEGLAPAEAFQRAVIECWEASGPDPRVCGGLQLIVNHVED